MRALLLVPLALASCVGVGARIDKIQTALTDGLAELDAKVATVNAEHMNAYEALNARLDSGEISFEQYKAEADRIDEIREEATRLSLAQAKGEFRNTVRTEVDGFKADIEAAKETAGGAVVTATKVASGVLGLGPAGDAAALAVASMLGLNTLRNGRRRRRGEPV